MMFVGSRTAPRRLRVDDCHLDLFPDSPRLRLFCKMPGAEPTAVHTSIPALVPAALIRVNRLLGAATAQGGT